MMSNETGLRVRSGCLCHLTSLAVTAALSLAGCGGLDQGDEEVETIATTSSPLLLTATPWPQNANGVHEVPVCFTSEAQAHPDYDVLRERFARVVNNSWGTVANLRFRGWGSCGSSTAGKIVISFRPRGAKAGSAYGYNAGGPTSMGLAEDNGERESDYGVIIHEFGHALGFQHERGREDWPAEGLNGCSPSSSSSAGDTLGTPPDFDSIMAATGYCQSNDELSAWDIVGVQNLYGRKKPGMIVGTESRCVEIEGGDSTQGNAIQINDCHGDVRQIWSWNRYMHAPAYRAPVCTPIGCIPLPSAFMDVGGDGGNHAPVVVGASGSTPIGLEGMWIKGMGGYCVDAPDMLPGAIMQIYSCHHGSNQKWTIDPPGRIRNGNLCFEIPGGSTASGTRVTLATCNGSANQAFTLTEKGEIKFQNKCVDVRGGQPTNQAQLQLAACKADTDVTKLRQRFHLRGTLRALGRCLDIGGTGIVNGTDLQIYDCHGRDNQIWDYYFTPTP